MRIFNVRTIICYQGGANGKLTSLFTFQKEMTLLNECEINDKIFFTLSLKPWRAGSHACFNNRKGKYQAKRVHRGLASGKFQTFFLVIFQCKN